MAIVRNDKRQGAIKILADVRDQMHALLIGVDALQAIVEGLELELGLANERDQANRPQYAVLHYEANEVQGHPLELCTEECQANGILAELEEPETSPVVVSPNPDAVTQG